MRTSKQIAKHLREVYFGGNWTASNLKDNLAGLTWQQATKQVYSFNSIATLVNHLHYYVKVDLRVLQGGPLAGKDSESFSHPPIQSQADWDGMLQKIYSEAEYFAKQIEQLPDEKLWEVFVEEKYGNYYRNLHGIIEHVHYHLGQIVLVRKILEG